MTLDVVGWRMFLGRCLKRTCNKEAGPLRQARVFVFSQISQIALQFCFVQISRLEMLRCAMCHYAVWQSCAATSAKDIKYDVVFARTWLRNNVLHQLQ